MIDTHCHFDFAPFNEDYAYWVKKFHQAGVNTIVIPSVCAKSWQTLPHLTQQFSSLYYALGLHPAWIQAHHEDDLVSLDKQISLQPEHCVGIGEIGLDFAFPDLHQKKQLFFLREQLAIAARYDLPVLLHCRKAHHVMLRELNAFPTVKGILHAFSGNEQIGMEYIRRGFMLGIGGTITYPRARKTRDAVMRFPLSHLVLETDAPDMPLMGYQGAPNSPDKLGLVASSLAELKGESEECILAETTENARRVFQI